MKNQKEKNNIFFSIVVCTYNGEKYIKRCIESLLHQDFPKDKYEIIVVCDGSKDKTKKIVKKKFPTVKLMSHIKNKGIATARNTGLKHAKGKVYVGFDDDCHADSKWLKNLYEVYKTNKIATIAGVGGLVSLQKDKGMLKEYLVESGYGNPSPVHFTKATHVFSRFFSYLKNMFIPHIESNDRVIRVGEIWGANSSFPIKILKAIGGWNENLSGVEDTDVCKRISLRFPSYMFYITKNAVVYHDRIDNLLEFYKKAYTRGKPILAFYNGQQKIPPIFPFPILLLASSALITLVNWHIGVSFLFVSPLFFYSWWVYRAVLRKKVKFLLFSYIQFGYELSTIFGLCFAYINTFVKLPKIHSLRVAPRIAAVFIIGALIVFTNIFVLENTSVFFVRDIVASVFLFLIPGFLISWAAAFVYKSVWEGFVYCIGISLAFLMLGGLAINALLPYIPSLHNPLSLLPLLIYFDIAYLVIGGIAFYKNSQLPLPLSKPSFSIENLLLIATPIIFPLLAIVGTTILNNNGSNIFTLVMLGSIATFVMLVTTFREKIPSGFFAWMLFLMSASLLFMTSLRGWYITGHDINLEYYVFQLTKMHNLWNIANFKDPYNACLSITILPTIISRFVTIRDEYVYKVIFQLLFSTSIVTTFLFLRKFLQPFLAFLGAFIIISLPTFMTDMPFLNRQEIALLFFALLLNTLFLKNLSPVRKFLLFLLFSLGMLVSHYSTTYLAVLLFAGTYIFHQIVGLTNIHRKSRIYIQKISSKLGFIESKPNLHIGMVVILIGITFIWNVDITQTSAGIVKTVTQIVSNLHKVKPTVSAYSALGAHPSSQTLINTYVATQTAFVRKFNTDIAFLPKSIYSQFSVTSVKQLKEPVARFGNFLAKLHISAYAINDALKNYYAKMIQLFILVGFVAVFLLKKHLTNFEKEYYFLTVTFFGILVVQLVLPNGSIDYGLLRLFQQGMILFAIPLLIGGLAIFSIFDKIHVGIKYYLLTSLFVFFFLYLSGFIPEVTGGYYPQLNVANGGFYYDAYYTHPTDIAEMTWLAKNRNPKTPIQSDWFTLNKIHAYEGFYSFDAMVPSTIRVTSYVYLSTFNITNNAIIEYIGSDPVYYTYNFGILDNNKNLIYNNGEAKIYR